MVHEAVAEDHLPVVAAPDVGLDGHVGQPGGVVEADALLEAVDLHAAARQHHQLGHTVLIVRVQEQRGGLRRRGVADHHVYGLARGPDGDLLQQRAEDLHAAASARQAQEGQAGLRCQRSVDPQSVIHEDPVGAALDGEHTDAAGSHAGRSRSPAWPSLSCCC